MFAAMLSLTTAICNNNMINGDDYSRAIPDNAALVKKLKEVVEMDKVGTTDGWMILKRVCQMLIALVQLKPSCISELNQHNFKEALPKGLATMSGVDNCMLFAGGDEREVPARSLTSLVQEVQEFLAKDQGDIYV
ncbi:hypothetical protein D1007_42084 [Hordeum vulgare]|nr:hypothetical protein D1007_42084 [Hordeum vulgare]